jgi:hypothetical protein
MPTLNQALRPHPAPRVCGTRRLRVKLPPNHLPFTIYHLPIPTTQIPYPRSSQASLPATRSLKAPYLQNLYGAIQSRPHPTYGH